MKKRRSAIALTYTDRLEAPLILASGKDALADRMLEIARACGITVVSDPVLADILSDAEIGACIPPETYAAVAAVFAFLDRGLDEKWF